jgi:hypothetical protein
VPNFAHFDVADLQYWFFRHGAGAFDFDSKGTRHNFREYHAKRLGLVNPKKIKFDRRPIHFDTMAEFDRFVTERFRPNLQGRPMMRDATFYEFIVSDKQPLLV